MADFQPQGQNWSEKNPVIGAGEGEVPLANVPTMDVTMRTMSSDVASIKETGGGEPKPYNPQAPVMPAPVTPPGVDFGGGAPMAAEAVQQAVVAPAKKTNWFAIIAIFVGIVAVLALGYFFIYPVFFSKAPAPAAPAVVTPPPAQPAPAPAPVAPTSTPTSTAATDQFQTVVLHSTLFKSSADASMEATLPTPALAAIQSTFQSNPVQVPLLKEVVMKNGIGKVYALSAIAPLFLPTIFTASTTALFEPDASFFVYVDKNGSWPGVVMKLASGVDPLKAKAAIVGLERGTEYLSFYTNNPGTPGRWKDGKVSTFIARYISFSTPNTAFSYTWANNYLVLSSSYAGAQAAVTKLGL